MLLTLLLLHSGNKMPSGASALLPLGCSRLPVLPCREGSSFGWPRSSTKAHKKQCIPPPEERYREAWGNEKVFPSPEHTRSCRAALPAGQPAPPAVPPQSCRGIALVEKWADPQAASPSHKHHVGILVFLLLKSSLIYPKTTSLLLKASKLYWVISNASSGHHVWVDDTVPSPLAKQSFWISLLGLKCFVLAEMMFLVASMCTEWREEKKLQAAVCLTNDPHAKYWLYKIISSVLLGTEFILHPMQIQTRCLTIPTCSYFKKHLSQDREVCFN